MNNPYSHIVPKLFTDYSLPSGLPSGLLFGLSVLLPVLFLPVDKGVERREEKDANSEIFSVGFFQKWFPP